MAKKCYLHFKKKFSEKSKISVVYKLLKKSQNILKIISYKSLSLRDLFTLDINRKKYTHFFTHTRVKMLTHQNVMIFQLQNYLQIFVILTYFEPCIKFSSCFCYPTFFHQHFKKKFQKNQKLLLSINNSKKLQPYTKNRFGQKLVLRKNSRFSVTFFFVFLEFLENCWKMITFDYFD
ncbi:hypothetical protein AGLY_013829 [Aphis glycines]|uniref:Uncharacterized protein n=1 Tax=Aphis glycines TaxID=307491 RepID=A0A6G0T565_APHGL|nr:hypothetical protein AGLY_013829 [Aphis glycines]